jgi:hypothetical protein
VVTSRYHQRVAIALVAFTIATIWFVSGVAVNEAARFVVFEVFYVVLPGCLLYIALSSDPGGRLRTVAIGWPLGYAIELGAFSFSAALHEREAFTFLPFVSVALAAVLLRRTAERRRTHEFLWSFRSRGKVTALPQAGPEAIFVAMTISAVLILLALQSFTFTPLPGHFQSVAYTVEEVFPISLAAEARNHWPMTTPWVAGLPLRYYTAVFIHGAAINQATGVELSTVYLRLFPTTATLLLALQLFSLGSSLGRSRYTGMLAIALFFLVEAATLNPLRSWPFEGNASLFFWGSATFPFGALFFLALLSLMQSWLSDSRSVTSRRDVKDSGPLRRREIKTLSILAMLVLCCGAAKMFAAVDFVGGLGLFWFWSIATKKPFRLLPYSLIVSVACLGVIYFFMLSGGGAKVVDIWPLNTLFVETFPIQVRELAPSVVEHPVVWTMFLICVSVIIVACLSAPVLGALWLLLRRSTLSSFEVFCLAVLLAGFTGYYLTFGSSMGAEIYFRIYAYVAFVLLAAGGLADFWNDTPKNARHAIVTGSGTVLILSLAVTGGSRLLALTGQTGRLWYIAMCGLVGGVVIFTAFSLNEHYAPVISSRAGRTLACCIPLLGVLGLVRPIAYATIRAKATILHQRIAPTDSPVAYGMTAALYRGMVWVRKHTRTCDVLAVNNHDGSATPTGSTAYLNYSAFTERRVFLENSEFTPDGVMGLEPFPGRLALSNSAILHGNPRALRQLAREGVSYVLVDKTHRGGAPEPPSVSKLVFGNSALDVYQLLKTVSVDPPKLGCGTEM